MLISLLSWILSWYQQFREGRMARYLRLIHKHLSSSSLVFRATGLGEGDVTGHRYSKLVGDCRGGWVETELHKDDSLEVLGVKPELTANLRYWTAYLNMIGNNSCHGDADRDEEVCHFILQVAPPDDTEDFLRHIESIPEPLQVQIEDLAEPVAWKPGHQFGILMQSTPRGLAKITTAFAEGCLILNDLLQLRRLMTVQLEGSAVELVRSNSQQPEPSFSQPPTPRNASLSNLQPLWDEMRQQMTAPVISEELEEQTRTTSDHSASPSLGAVQFAVGDRGNGSNESLASENDFIDYAVADQMVFAPHDPQLDVVRAMSESSNGLGDTAAGEAPSESLEELAPEVLTPAHRHHANRMKPPNILVYCKKDSQRRFDSVKAVLQQCVNPDRYAIYPLLQQDIRSAPWQENCVLLVVPHPSPSKVDKTDRVLLDYFLSGGTVITFNSASFEEHLVEREQMGGSRSVLPLSYGRWRDVPLICASHLFANCESLLPDVNLTQLAGDKQTGRPVLIEAIHELSGGVALLSQVHLEKGPHEMAISPEIFTLLKKSNHLRFDILRSLLERMGVDCSQGNQPKLTPCYMLATHQNKASQLMDSIRGRLHEKLLKTRDVSLLFCDDPRQCPTDITSEQVPVITSGGPDTSQFSLDIYRDHLQTRTLGQVIFYTDTVATTMTLLDGLHFSLPDDVGVIAIASQQIAGQGRGGNAWLSPCGCAMFTLHVRIALHTELGQHIAFLQHIAALAVVEAVTGLPDCENLDLRLKWPNDIYSGRQLKLGGVLVKSSIMGNTIHASIGCGVNVSNHDPTVCLNDLLQQQHSESNRCPLLRVEQVIAATVTQMERLIDMFQKDGPTTFLQLYYARWLHSGAAVRLTEADQEVTVVGLDDHGYLSVQTPEGATQSLHPDGNSFDMMRNLIVPKTNG